MPGCCILIVWSRQSRCVDLVGGACFLCVTGVVACVNGEVEKTVPLRLSVQISPDVVPKISI